VRLASLAALLLLLSTSGCSLILPLRDEQCDTVADCEARGFADAVCKAGVCEHATVVDPVWGCLGNVVEPIPDMTKKVQLDMQIVLAGDKSPVTMATVDVCAKLDLDCTGMSPDFPKGLTPDAGGNVSFSVIQGFDGFVRFSGPEIMDSRVFVGRPVVTPPQPMVVWLLKPSDYNILAAFAGQDVDPTRGTSIMFGVDCQGIGASGVRFESPNADAGSMEFYLINEAPSSPPAATATDHDGYGGFFNLPVGSALAKSYRAEDDVYVGESSFHVLANTISYVEVAPTPQ